MGKTKHRSTRKSGRSKARCYRSRSQSPDPGARDGDGDITSRSRSRSPDCNRNRSRTQRHSRSSDRSQGRSRSRNRSRSPRRYPLQLRLKAVQYVARGDVRRLRKLLRRHQEEVDLGAVDSHGRTLLHHACACGHSAVAALLRRRGAPAGAVDAGGDTPAHLAARGGHLEALADALRAPDAPPLDAAGLGGVTLRELMGRALRGASGAAASAAAKPPDDHLDGGAGAGERSSEAVGEEEDEEARWRLRLREECSDGEGGGPDWGPEAAAAGGGGGGGYGFAGEGDAAAGETDEEWANRLWREMQRRRSAAASAAAASFTADLRAEAARRADEAAERSRRILQEERAKDTEWRRRTLAAIEAGPATPPLDLAAARVSYDERWAQLEAQLATAAATTVATENGIESAGIGPAPPRAPGPQALAPQALRYQDIPWPLEPPDAGGRRGAEHTYDSGRTAAAAAAPPPARLPPPPSVGALRDFFLLGATGPGDVKRRLRAELLRWHPDKFGARLGGRLAAAGPGHAEAALARVQQLAQVLTQVLGPAGAAGGGR